MLLWSELGIWPQFHLPDYPVGIAVAVPLPKHIIKDLQLAPTREYYELYTTLNDKLNAIVTAGEEYLISRGYHAYALTTDRIMVDSDNHSSLPHKTVATRAALADRQNCLLVTPQYGSAVRISSLLTDAPLTCDAPITRSQCGACHACVRYCPAHALKIHCGVRVCHAKISYLSLHVIKSSVRSWEKAPGLIRICVENALQSVLIRSNI